MENFQTSKEAPNENIYVKKIEEIKTQCEGEKMFPLGQIVNVSYADLGKTLSIELSGDVPSNFKAANIIIVHPDSENEGWIGKGNIGITIEGSGADIGRIPLPEESVNFIKDIYQKYTGKEARISFNSHYGNDATKFADLGLYNRIIEEK